MSGARQYLGGLPFEGWKRGPKIWRLDQLEVGNVLISVSHQYRTESLIKVVEVKPNGYYCLPLDADLKPADRTRIFCWDFDVASESHECFLAVRA